jgi:cell division protein FtsB
VARLAGQPDLGPGRQGGAGPAGRRDAPGRTLPAVRTPFILVVLALLGGGLVCLLVINTTLATATFQISNLQRQNVTLSQQEQALQEQVASDQSPAKVEREARHLGMTQQQQLKFISAQTGRIYTPPATVKGVVDIPAGYVP